MTKKLTIISFLILGLCARAHGKSRFWFNKEPLKSNPTQTKEASEASKGPTVYLDYDGDRIKENTIGKFMYFVPMISTVPVYSETSTGNQQMARIISCKKKQDSKSFEVLCEFEMWGKGFHKNKFDTAEVINTSIEDIKKGAALKNMLDYIRFEGNGFGNTKIKGKIVDGIEYVTDVEVNFNCKGQESPVTVGLYSIKPANGKYKFKNRHNELVAKVNKLIFKNVQENPRMGIKIASISDIGKKAGFCAKMKGTIANLFIKPIKITKAGNDAMLEFGYALYKGHASFTFPKAENLKEKPKRDIGILAQVTKLKSKKQIDIN